MIPAQRIPATQLGTVIGDYEPETPEWFAVRRGGITATDLPKILGLSKYGNARSVWHDKRGELPDEPAGEAALWGQLLEDVVAQEWARRHDVTVARVGIIANADQPWMRASLDRLIQGQNAALEVKTRSAFVAGKWRDDLPDDVLAQVAWQRIVTGLDYIDVACLIGGQRLIEHRYTHDPELETYILTAATDLWNHVLDGTPPPADHDATLIGLLNLLHPDRVGHITIDPEAADALIANYLDAQALEREADTAKTAAKAAVLEVLGDADTLEANGVPIFTYTPQTRRNIALSRLTKSDPELYARLESAGHITETTTRTMRCTHKETTP